MDPRRTWRVALRTDDTTAAFRAPATAVQLGPASYVWHPHGASGFARPDGPLVRRRLPAGTGHRVALPPWSLTVVQWPPSNMP